MTLKLLQDVFWGKNCLWFLETTLHVLSSIENSICSLQSSAVSLIFGSGSQSLLQTPDVSWNTLALFVWGCLAVWLRLASTCHPFVSASQVPVITNMHQHAWLLRTFTLKMMNSSLLLFLFQSFYFIFCWCLVFSSLVTILVLTVDGSNFSKQYTQQSV